MNFLKKLDNKEKAALLFLSAFIILSFLGILLSGKIKVPIKIGATIVVALVILLVGIRSGLQYIMSKSKIKK